MRRRTILRVPDYGMAYPRGDVREAYENVRCLPKHQETIRGCTLGGNFNYLKGRESAMLGVWAPPGAAQNPKMTDFRSLFF